MSTFVNSFLFVVVGEMGDKTQLLAMGMAGRYKARYVMLGVLIATLLNHALAVLVGSYISTVLPMGLISIVAGASFLAFGLWTIYGDVDDSRHKASRFGPVVTVAIAFFFAEMADKTQLMTMTLAAEYKEPVFILMGTTLGMLAADGLGVFCSSWICKHLPQRYIKWGAGVIFMIFGTISLYNNAPDGWLTPLTVIAYLLVLGALVYLVGVRFARRTPEPCEVVGEEVPSIPSSNSRESTVSTELKAAK